MWGSTNLNEVTERQTVPPHYTNLVHARTEWSEDHSILLFLNSSLLEKAFSRANPNRAKSTAVYALPQAGPRCPFWITYKQHPGVCFGVKPGAGPGLPDTNHIKGSRVPMCGFSFPKLNNTGIHLTRKYPWWICQTAHGWQPKVVLDTWAGKKAAAKINKWMKTLFCSFSSVNVIRPRRLGQNFEHRWPRFQTVETKACRNMQIRMLPVWRDLAGEMTAYTDNQWRSRGLWKDQDLSREGLPGRGRHARNEAGK